MPFLSWYRIKSVDPVPPLPQPGLADATWWILQMFRYPE
jgi:hypothetical protein